jgi:uncharacterized membrane protein
MERAGMSAGKALALGAISGLRSASGPAFVGDKLSVAPSRTGWPPLLGRAVSGGLAGAAVFLSEGGPATTGAIIGSSAAVAAAFAGENLRALVASASGLPDLGVAIAEDAVVLVVGSRATSKAVR